MAKPRRDLLKEDLELFPDLSFWYGLSFFELVRTPNWVLRLYAQALSRLKADYEIVHNRAASFAHMKKSAQREVMSNLNRRVREGQEPRRLKSKGAVEFTLGGMGFAVDDQRTKKSEEKKD